MQALETDVAERFERRERTTVELRFDIRAGRALLVIRPFGGIDAVDHFAVELNGDHTTEAGNAHFVPFARLFRNVFARRLETVERTAGVVVRFLTGVVEELDFDGVRNPVALVGALNQEAAVGVFGEVEFKFANERGVFFLRPDDGVFRRDEFAFVVERPNAFREVAVFEFFAEERNHFGAAPHHRAETEAARAAFAALSATSVIALRAVLSRLSESERSAKNERRRQKRQRFFHRDNPFIKSDESRERRVDARQKAAALQLRKNGEYFLYFNTTTAKSQRPSTLF